MATFAKRPADHTLCGIHPVEEALQNRSREIEKVLFEKRAEAGSLFQLLKRCRKMKIPCQTVDRRRLRDVAGTASHQGVVAICSAKPYWSEKQLLDHLARETALPLLVVPDSVEDPRNLGALIRTGLAAGVHGLLLPKQGTSGLTNAVAKTSAGSLEKMPVARSNDIARCLRDLAAQGYAVIGLDAKAPLHYRKADYGQPLVLVVGGEDRGIRPHVRRCCSQFVNIPMDGRCQSLNLSVAAGIVLFEAAAQRAG